MFSPLSGGLTSFTFEVLPVEQSRLSPVLRGGAQSPEPSQPGPAPRSPEPSHPGPMWGSPESSKADPAPRSPEPGPVKFDIIVIEVKSRDGPTKVRCYLRDFPRTEDFPSVPTRSYFGPVEGSVPSREGGV